MSSLKQKLLRIAILAGILLLLALPLMFWLEDFVRDAILLPLSYYVWLFRMILRALPQTCLLTALLSLLAFLALRSLRPPKPQPEPPRAAGSPAPRGQVSIWDERLRLVTQGEYSRTRFAYHLAHLALRVLAYDERLDTRQVMRALQVGRLDVPDQIRNYVQTAAKSEFRPTPWRLRSLLRRFVHKRPRPTITGDVLPVITYIETKLGGAPRTEDASTISSSEAFK